MGNVDVLSDRYATPEINEIFSAKGKNIRERRFWLSVMKAQKALGYDIPSEDIEKFERVVENVNLERIREKELKTRHDIKAKIESFVEDAGAGEYVHRGMTSRALTDNVEMIQIRDASKIIFGRNVSVLRHFLERAKEFRDIVMTARTHHQPAQATLLGRRFSMWAEEHHYHLLRFEKFIEDYPLRGIKGPVGTHLDMIKLLGSEENVLKLEKRIAQENGFKRVLNSPGQVYPRSLDYALGANLVGLSAALQSFATTMRLMGGYETMTEGFKKGQVGSTAMPYKMNTRSSERVCGFSKILKGYQFMLAQNSGDQWEEGDVSCSAVRRVAIPGMFYAMDGMCETGLTILNELGAYHAMIDKELNRYIEFLAGTEMLMTAIGKGIGREEGHEVIKEHAIPAALAMREKGENPNLVSRLIKDKRFQEAGITRGDLESNLSDKKYFTGNAGSQITQVAHDCFPLLKKYSEQAKYEPGQIL